MGRKPKHPLVRFFTHVKRDPESGCWLWTGSIAANTGYGLFRVKVGGQWKQVLAHRWAYKTFRGRIPVGLDLDHVRERGCLHRHCVRPAHLEPITHRENIMRGDGVAARNASKTHCKYGHPFKIARGRRHCPTCHATWQRARTKRASNPLTLTQ